MADPATAPFASEVSSMAVDGTTPQDFDIKIPSRDILVVVQYAPNDATARVLHLKNVRKDTLAEAQTAINGFFDQFDPLDNGSPGNTVFQMFDKVYKYSREHVDIALSGVENARAELIEIDGDEGIYPKRPAAGMAGEDFNPIAEVIAACGDFLDRVESIQSKAQAYSKESAPKRYAKIVSKGNERSHMDIESYLQKTSMERNLGCDWYPQYYPGRLTDQHQVRYHVHFDQNKGWVYDWGN